LQEQHHWPGLQSIVQVAAQRTDKKNGATTTESRLFIRSLPANAERLLATTRAHWSIENTLHWSLLMLPSLTMPIAPAKATQDPISPPSVTPLPTSPSVTNAKDPSN
jgi:hypothetical protein